MPHDPVTVRDQFVPKSSRGGHDQTVVTQYVAPTEGDDPHQRMDLANAAWMMDVLTKAYPGYSWRCVYDGAQKMAYFSIPIVMGVNKFWAINLTTDEMTDGLLKRGAGELLERYRLPRSGFEIGSFLEARENHSALVIPGRKVPT